MPLSVPMPGRVRRSLAVVGLVVSVYLACPSIAGGQARAEPLALSSLMAPSGELERMVPHVAAFVSFVLLVSMTMSGQTPLDLGFFAAGANVRKQDRRRSPPRRR